MSDAGNPDRPDRRQDRAELLHQIAEELRVIRERVTAAEDFRDDLARSHRELAEEIHALREQMIERFRDDEGQS